MYLLESSKIESVATRHRILIAAAVAATFGKVEIRGIRPAAWTRRRAAGVRSAPLVHHQNPAVEPVIPEEEEAMCDS
jgi:hypothetical protein